MKTRHTALLSFVWICIVHLSFAQERTVSGVISDGSGVPLLGATILIKGSVQGTSTDFDGKYRIKATTGNILVIRFVGYTTKEVPVGDSDIINVTLIEDTSKLGEVVVTALGVSKQKKALGYAISEIKGKDIEQTQAVNPMSALQGKVTGLDISAAPGPGATQNVVIRGISSFGNVQPLYIVDGIPLTNEQNRSGNSLNNQADFGSGINAINPDDIENITILKGASSTALYGSRASNGVILITTKSGKSGKLRININSSYGLSRVGFLPKTQNEFGQGWNGNRALDENGNWGARYDGLNRVWGHVLNNSQKIKPYVYLENNIRDFYDYGQNIKNAISFSGGDAENTFSLSVSQNDVDGVIPSDKDHYTRYTLSGKATHQAKRLRLNIALNYARETTSVVPSGQGNSLARSLREIASDISIVDLQDYTNDPFNTLDNYFTPFGLNPYFVIDNNGAVQKKNKFFGKFEIEYNLLNDLNLMYRFSGDFETSNADAHTGIVSFSPDSYNDGASGATQGNYQQTKRERFQTNHDIMMTYTKDFSEDFGFNAIAGLTANERNYNWIFGRINSIDVPGFYNLSNSITPSTSGQYRQKRRLVGLYLNTDFNYKDYLFLNATARNDWSSTLPLENNSFFYAGVNSSFILSSFLNNLDVDTGILNYSKLRVGYGSTGNDAGVYRVYDRYVPGAASNPSFPNIDDLVFPLNSVNAFMASNRLGNPNLKPEITTEFEVGIENRLFNNRFGFEFSYYNRFTEGLIENLLLDPSSGYTSRTSNLGDIRNKGYELSVNLIPLKSKNFKWNILWNYSTNDNKVERLDVEEIQVGGFGGGGIYAVEGMPLGQFKFTKVKTTTIDGEQRTVVDGNGNPQATTDTELLGKDIQEKYRMGLINTITWKGLSLSATLDFRYGGYIYSGTKDYLHWVGSSPESILNDRNAFIVPGSVIENEDNSYSENTVPVNPTELHTFYSQGGFNGESYAVINKSYLKLRNIVLAYDIPQSILKNTGIKSIRASLTASNFLLWRHKENPYIDPETTTFGNNVSGKFGEYSGNPTEQVYTFGLNIQL